MLEDASINDVAFFLFKTRLSLVDNTKVNNKENKNKYLNVF